MRSGPYRIGFWTQSRNEPPQVQVELKGDYARFRLQPIELIGNYGLKPSDLHRIEHALKSIEDRLVDLWLEHHGPFGPDTQAGPGAEDDDL
jgi:hypothetical protein